MLGEQKTCKCQHSGAGQAERAREREMVFVCMCVVGWLFDGGWVGPYKNQPRSNKQFFAKQPPTTNNQQWTNSMPNNQQSSNQPRTRCNRLPAMHVCSGSAVCGLGIPLLVVGCTDKTQPTTSNACVWGVGGARIG